MKEAFARICEAPRKAWEFSHIHPLEAFCYGGICLVFAWGAKIFLSIIAIALMSGAIAKLLEARQ